MNIYRVLFVLILSVVSLFYTDVKGQSKTAELNGYIYNVKLDVDENIMERALVKGADNSIYYKTIYKRELIIGYETIYISKVDEKWLDKNHLNTKANGRLYEMFNQNETNQLLTDFSKILVSKTENETVDFIKGTKGSVISGMLGNLTSNAMGSNKMSFYLPNKKNKSNSR